jgi:hypothetical protein
MEEMIKVKRIGVILPDGVVEGYYPEKEPYSDKKSLILGAIREARMVRHSELLTRYKRHVDGEELARITKTLMKAGEIFLYTPTSRGGTELLPGVRSSGAKRYASREEHERRLKNEGGLSEHVVVKPINRVSGEIEKRQAYREKEKRFNMAGDQILTQKMEPINLRGNIWAYKDTIVQVLTDDHYYPKDEIVLQIKRYVLSIEKKVMSLEAEVFSLEGLEKDKGKRRERIPENVRLFVWRRDEGRCVECGSNENLEFDHIIPISKGGSSTVRNNIQLLCGNCNRLKSDNI